MLHAPSAPPVRPAHGPKLPRIAASAGEARGTATEITPMGAAR